MLDLTTEGVILLSLFAKEGIPYMPHTPRFRKVTAMFAFGAGD
jgi:hypothetical protein